MMGEVYLSSRLFYVVVTAHSAVTILSEGPEVNPKPTDT